MAVPLNGNTLMFNSEEITISIFFVTPSKQKETCITFFSIVVVLRSFSQDL